MVSQDWGSLPSSGRPGPLPGQGLVTNLIAGPGPLTFFYFVFLDLLRADLVGL